MGTVKRRVTNPLHINVHDDYGIDTTAEDFDWDKQYHQYDADIDQTETGVDIGLSASAPSLADALAVLDDCVASLKTAITEEQK